MDRSDAPSAPESDGTHFERVLSFSVRGNAHFRKIEGNSTAQTYRVIPRTTAAGLMAALMGCEWDSYYDLFRRNNSVISVVPETPLRPQPIPISEVDTDDSEMTTIGPDDSIELPHTWDLDRDAQRNPYVYLLDVQYRLVVGLADETAYTTLRDALETGSYGFPPYLGRSDCLASVTFHGEFTPEPVETTTIHSALPGEDGIMCIVPDIANSIESERSPAEMELRDGKPGNPNATRATTDWMTWTVRTDTGASDSDGGLTLAEPTEAWQIGDRTVVFG